MTDNVVMVLLDLHFVTTLVVHTCCYFYVCFFNVCCW